MPQLVPDASAPWNGGEVFLRPAGSGRSGGSSSSGGSQVLGYCRLTGDYKGSSYSCAATYYDAYHGHNVTTHKTLPEGYLEII